MSVGPDGPTRGLSVNSSYWQVSGTVLAMLLSLSMVFITLRELFSSDSDSRD